MPSEGLSVQTAFLTVNVGRASARQSTTENEKNGGLKPTLRNCFRENDGILGFCFSVFVGRMGFRLQSFIGKAETA
ncbi:TPA: hypothetical protein ACP1WE_001745, partial [Neisseria meningitidis]